MNKLTNPKLGDKCVVADFVGTVIYTVAGINKTGNVATAHLSYPRDDGVMVSGGLHPLCCCYEPTSEQLKYKG